MKQFSILITVFYLVSAVISLAGPLQGEKRIILLGGAGGVREVGVVRFGEQADQVAYEIRWNEAEFTDHFLSMRPFRCLEGPAQHWCHLGYPYELRRQVSAGDLTDLEYDLLFLHKAANEYGINLWNGVYYRLHIEGDRLAGQMHELDMGLLSAPPEDGELRPILPKHLHETDPESHWLPRIVIE